MAMAATDRAMTETQVGWMVQKAVMQGATAVDSILHPKKFGDVLYATKCWVQSFYEEPSQGPAILLVFGTTTNMLICVFLAHSRTLTPAHFEQR